MTQYLGETFARACRKAAAIAVAGAALSGCGIFGSSAPKQPEGAMLPSVPPVPSWTSDDPWSRSISYQEDVITVDRIYRTAVKLTKLEAEGQKETCIVDFLRASGEEGVEDDERLMEVLERERTACLKMNNGDYLRRNIALMNMRQDDLRALDELHRRKYEGKEVGKRYRASALEGVLQAACPDAMARTVENNGELSRDVKKICQDYMPR